MIGATRVGALERLIAAVGLLVIALALVSRWLNGAAARESRPLLTVSERLQSRVALAHVWFEEAMAGNPAIDLGRDVYASLDEGMKIVGIMLAGGVTKEGPMAPLPGPEARANVLALGGEIREFRRITEERWSRRATLRPGNPLDLAHDQAFRRILALTGENDRLTDRIVFDRQALIRRIDAVMAILALVLVFGVTAVAARGLRRMARASEELLRGREALRESQAFLEQAQQVGHIGSWVSGVDRDDRLTWSKEMFRIFGVSPERFDGTFESFLSFVHPDDRSVRAAFQDAIPRDAGPPVEYRVIRADGTTRWVHEQAEVVRDAGGRPLRMIGTVQDVTERRQLEEQMRQAQKMDAAGRLAGGVAHDFNNLLTVILGYSDLLRARLGPDHALQEDVQQVRKAAERASSLTRQLLAFSRKQVLTPVVLDLNAIVADLEKMLRRLIGEDVDFVTVLDPSLGRVKADAGHIEQVIVNLVVNARDAMPRGGKLTIETRNVDIDDSYARRHLEAAPGAYVMLAVTDTGSGMDEQTRSHIFEPFFTTKAAGKGTGLGLSTVYGIVKQSGGQVEVYSEVGRGTTFKIYLPRVAEEAAAAPPKPPAKTSGGSETILLVEDDAALRTLARRVLEARGYRVLEAGSAEEAESAAAAFSGTLHLMVSDTVMPGGSGPDLARRLAASRPDMKVLFMSGYTDDAVVRNGLLKPAQAFLQKPFTADALARRVREVLDGAA